MAEKPTLLDISPRIDPKLAVWPGDTPPSREVLLELSRGDTVTLSTLRSTVHLGAHADAPSHYAADGVSIEAVALDTYIGRCQVIRARATREDGRIAPEALEDRVVAERVLIRSDTYVDPSRFDPGFAALSVELVDHLADRGVRLVGVDTPSVDVADSKDLPAHRRCARHGIAIVEGLVLDEIEPGEYELVALPLALEGFDASPVRAVLRTLTPER